MIYGVGAYAFWGFLPIYWKHIHKANSLEILANRGVWSLVLCGILLIYRKSLSTAISIMKDRRQLGLLVISATLLTINWGVFIWGVSINRVVETALGYYIAPLLNVLFGIMIFKENLRKLQCLAVTLGLISVLTVTYEYKKIPWIAVALALSWGTYGMVKKHIDLGALETLSIETLITFIPNLILIMVLANKGTAQLGHGIMVTTLLVLAGVATVIPLLLFNGAVVRLPLSTLGLLQYITPTLFFFLGVFHFHESMTVGKVIGFGFIWAALFVLSLDLTRSANSVNN